MMLWIYNLPEWAAGIIIVSFTVLMALGGHRLGHRLFSEKGTGVRSSLVSEVFSAVVLVLSLLIAFMSVTVWDAYSKAEVSLEHEASIAGELSRDLSIIGSPRALATREALRAYLRMIVDVEWPSMARGRESIEAAHAFNRVFRLAGRIEVNQLHEQVLLGEIWNRTNELNTYRRGRLDTLKSAVPDVLWVVIFAGMLISFVLFFDQPVNRFSQFLLAAYALSIGLILFFIIAMDRPFSGKEAISSKPFKSALESMHRWDTEKSPDRVLPSR